MELKQMADLKKRLFVSLISAAIVLLLIFFSPNLFVSGLLVLAVATLVGVGVWEYAKLARGVDFQPLTSLMITVGIVEVIAFFVSLRIPHLSQLPLIVMFVGVIAFFLAHFHQAARSIAHVALAFFGVCYVAVPLSFMLGILYPTASAHLTYDGRWWLIYLILVTKITDVAGYFVGRLWGKRKLAPVLSPKKTLEGAIAGFLSSVLMSVVLAILGASFSHGGFLLSISNALWLGALIGVLGQIGDLAESLLKRDAAVKDSNSLPGLGGVLDMVDSLLLTAPVVYFFMGASP